MARIQAVLTLRLILIYNNTHAEYLHGLLDLNGFLWTTDSHWSMVASVKLLDRLFLSEDRLQNRPCVIC